MEIKLSEILIECDKFLSGQQTDEDKLEITSLFNSIEVKPRISIITKKVIFALMDTSMNLEEDIEDARTLRLSIERNMVLHGLISYTDIKKDVFELKDVEYDSLLLSGFIDFIEAKCMKDYNEVTQMYLDTLNLSTLISTTKAIEDINVREMGNNIQKIQELQANITPGALESIAKIFEYNDPTLKKLKEEVIDTVQKEQLLKK